MALSTTPTGTISQTARGLLSFLTKSASDAAPTAFSFTSSATAFADLSNTTHWWPPFSRRRTMFAAHPAEADHSELHGFSPPWRNDVPVGPDQSPCRGRLWDASDRIGKSFSLKHRRHGALRGHEDDGLIRHDWELCTGHGFASQISAAYSAMVRSLENFPEPATFRMTLRAQASGSA